MASFILATASMRWNGPAVLAGESGEAPRLGEARQVGSRERLPRHKIAPSVASPYAPTPPPEQGASPSALGRT